MAQEWVPKPVKISEASSSIRKQLKETQPFPLEKEKEKKKKRKDIAPGALASILHLGGKNLSENMLTSRKKSQERKLEKQDVGYII